MEITLGFGSNIGDRRKNIEQALEMLEKELGKMIASSSLIETEPWGFECENLFLNSAAIFQTDKTPHQALTICNEVERRLGRQRTADTAGYSSRTMDIDILFCENQIIDTPMLQVPHPLIEKRDFVLQPLNEIMPRFVHPLLHQTIEKLYKDRLKAKLK